MAQNDAATELDAPIKIEWTGDARDKFRDRKVRARVSDGGPHGEEVAATLDRLKTRVVVRTEEEAEGLESMLEVMSECDYVWTTENHRNAYKRVLSELRAEFYDEDPDDEDEEDDDLDSMSPEGFVSFECPECGAEVAAASSGETVCPSCHNPITAPALDA